MDENKKLKSRMSQLEELVANTTRSVDKLTADVEVFREYAYENNKVVNGLLRKMDDRKEEIAEINKKILDVDKKFLVVEDEIRQLRNESLKLFKQQSLSLKKQDIVSKEFKKEQAAKWEAHNREMKEFKKEQAAKWDKQNKLNEEMVQTLIKIRNSLD